MDPTGPSQPPKSTAYQTEGVGVDSNPQELHAAREHSYGRPVETRSPGSQASGTQEGMPASLARGVRGAGQDRPGNTEQQRGNPNLDGEQMAVFAEGKTADAVRRKPGATGSEPDLASDLDRKKAEQAEEREAIKEARESGRITGDVDPRAGVQT